MLMFYLSSLIMLQQKIVHSKSIKMKKKFTFSLFLAGFLNFAFAQVGVNSNTPTESLDVNGTIRVHNLPIKASTSHNPVVNSENYNVIGKTTKGNLVPNKNVANFTADDNSSAMFVIKRYKISDYPSNGAGFDTQMSSDKWEAFLSNVGFSFSEIRAIHNIFNEYHLHSWQLRTNPTLKRWVIWGDINGVNENSNFVDILFIRKSVVAAENREDFYPF